MVLVTGATGMVGSHLVLHLLEQGQIVKALYRNESGKQKVKTVFDFYNKLHLFEKIIWCEADILDISSLENAFENTTIVYHCAGFISFDPNDEENLRKINIEGTANLVNMALAKNTKQFCFVSSIAAFGSPIKSEKIIDENADWNSEALNSDYAIAKHGAEMEVWRGFQEGLNAFVVNPGVILGPKFWKNGSGEIFEKVQNKMRFYTNGTTGFISVFDTVQIMVLLMERKISGEKFILISENKSYKNLVFEISEILKIEKPKFQASKTLTKLAWKIDWFLNVFLGKKRQLSRSMAKSLHSKDKYSNKKIVELLDYKFQDFETILKNALK
jgi:dihydroflavonol-4-reductase